MSRPNLLRTSAYAGRQQRGTGLPRMSRGTRKAAAIVMSRNASHLHAAPVRSLELVQTGTVPLLSGDNDNMAGNNGMLIAFPFCEA